jgi:hypothetical protein
LSPEACLSSLLGHSFGTAPVAQGESAKQVLFQLQRICATTPRIALEQEIAWNAAVKFLPEGAVHLADCANRATGRGRSAKALRRHRESGFLADRGTGRSWVLRHVIRKWGFCDKRNARVRLATRTLAHSR